jgi:hypothetical protein
VADMGDTLLNNIEAGLVTKWDMFIYIALVWGLWSIVLFEINGLIFGQGESDELAE